MRANFRSLFLVDPVLRGRWLPAFACCMGLIARLARNRERVKPVRAGGRRVRPGLHASAY